ncbi:adenylyl-sulfate kinase [Deltaproteobacteria bacterium Smac51]|nr:adenylyl-sulfate kinase [Deltaproteobacteria bacterium Smac51]
MNNMAEEYMNNKGKVIWITGLSATGKTTLAQTLLPMLTSPAIWYDGHHVRDIIAPVGGGGFDRQSRLRDARACSLIYKHAADQGLTVVCSTITMFHEIQQWNRAHLPGYFEVFLDFPEAVRRSRDNKALYAPPAGQSPGPIWGRDIVPEEPVSPQVHITDPSLTPEMIAEIIIEKLGGIDAKAGCS